MSDGSFRLPPPEGVEIIDVNLFGATELSCSYLVHAAEPTLIETGPASVFDTVSAELELRKVEPKHIVLTHIHLDHAGGIGHVADRFPDATIWVHTVGAPHIVDPSRLVASAQRLFGDALETMWGVPTPVAEGRVKIIDEGTVIPLGDRDLRVLYTPGHARHEVTLYDADSATAFVGDTVGVCYGDGWQKPATPPPEFDLEAALDSLKRLQAIKPERICFTHYGITQEASLERAAADLRNWDKTLRPLVERGADEEELIAAIEPVTGTPPGDDAFATAVTELSSNRNSVLGYVRYYQKAAKNL